MPFEAVSSAVAVISEKVCPPVHTVRVSSKILEFVSPFDNFLPFPKRFQLFVLFLA